MLKTKDNFFSITNMDIVDVHGCLYMFKMTIVDILNKDELSFSLCKKYSKKVRVI